MFNYSMVDSAPKQSATVIKVIGCGGGGSNAVDRMIEAGVQGVDFIAVNTDQQDLACSTAPTKIGIGAKITGGLGAGGNPDVGEQAALEDTDAIANIVRGANMVFITAGMGGGTGTGAAPVIARIAKEEGALTIGVVTKPFDYEGPLKMEIAKKGIAKLYESVDKIIVIPNQNLFRIIDRRTSLFEAYRKADDVLLQSIQGISDIITQTGLINVDFKDVYTTMHGTGEAIMGIGRASGDEKAHNAAIAAINNPMLEETRIDGAKNLLVNIIGSPDVSLHEADEIVNIVRENADPNVLVIHGVRVDDTMRDEIAVTVIATNFENEGAEAAPAGSPPAESREEKSDLMPYGDFITIATGGRQERKEPALTFAEIPRGDSQEHLAFDPVAPGDLNVPAYLRNTRISLEKD
ncbi:MAG: cell division protein FtsZ [Spirochaetaceae bacterium]|jgi:cell division protein FtsZ|nr:cell division protein FtsZ [Spirochaetaceae bacterium]